MGIFFSRMQSSFSRAMLVTLAITFVQPLVPPAQATDVVTQHNDNSRAGTNLDEVVLNTSNVNSTTFGKLFSRAVDGHIYAQPLYVSNVVIPGQGTHNVMYVCTMHNSVFAYDADDPSASAPLWQLNLGPSVPISVFGAPGDIGISVEIGILSTPVIDPSAKTLYVVAQTYENSAPVFRLHALDITTGAEKPGSPILIQGSVPGTGTDSEDGVVSFNASQLLQRPALLLLNGNVYIAFGSHGDDPVWHGWLLGYNAATLQQSGIFCTSPNSDSSGIWQSGIGPAADSSGNIFVVTGNGPLSANIGGVDYGDSILKLSSAGGIGVVDYFSPSNQQDLNLGDTDLGSGAPALIIPGTYFGVAGGKDGRVFLFNTNNLGQNQPNSDNVVQSWQTSGSFYGGSTYYNSTLYMWGGGTQLATYSFNGSTFNTTPTSQSSFSVSGDAGNQPAMSVSANGTLPGSAIVWAAYSTNGGIHAGAPSAGILRALDASDVSKELWNSNQVASRDSSGSWAKFNPPAVANGKVYLATFDGVVNVYGLIATPGSPAVVTAKRGSAQSAFLGTSFSMPLQATVQDANGNLLKGVQVTFAVPTVGPTATFGGSPSVTVTTDLTGVAHAPALTAGNQAGSYLATAYASGVKTPANFALTNTNIAGITAIGGALQNTVVNTAFEMSLQAKIVDGSSNPVSGVTVTFSAPVAGASATFSGATTVTAVSNAAGIAITPLPSANMIAGTYPVTASVGGVGTPATFTLTNAPSAPSTLGASGGSEQSTVVDTPFPAPLQATVKDAFGNPVSGVMVTFAAPASGASAAFIGSLSLGVLTNAAGIAVSQVPVASALVGAYSVAATVSGLPAVLFNLTNTAPPQPATATFVKTDWVTQGSWQSVYGGDGYNVIGDLIGRPSYVTPVASGQSSFTWAATTTDGRALEKASNPASRIAATWYSGSSFIVDMNLTDGAAHQVAFYCLDWDSTVRREKVDVLDTDGNILDTQVLGSSFNGGVYLVWKVSGHVQFRFTVTSGDNAVVSGLFFDAPTITISAVGGTPQNTTVATSFPAALQAAVKDAQNHPLSGVTVTFTATGTGAGATFGGATTATAATNNSGIATSPLPAANTITGTYSVAATVPGASIASSFALTNSAGAASTLRASGGTPQSSTVNTAFPKALQASVNDVFGNPVSGVTVTFTVQGDGASANFGGSPAQEVVTNGSGIAISPVPVANGVVGTYSVLATASGLPAVTYGLTNTAASGTATLRASGGTPQNTLVNTAFATTLQATVKDANGNPVSGVVVTFAAPSTGASATFGGATTARAVTNSSGIAVSPLPVANGVVGAYSASATAAGLPAVTFNLTNTAVPQPPMATFVKADWVTQGNWQSVYGAGGYNVIGDQASNPSYVTPQASGASSYTWAATTTDARALQEASNAAGRIAATWFSGSSFILDMNPTDTAVHQVALYCLDWDSTARREKVDVLDTDGNILDTEVLGSSFNEGVYLVWNVSGHVQFRFTVMSGNNAVVSGLFFDVPSNTLVTEGGTPQSTVVNTAFGTALQASVKDPNGNPVSGVTVTFTAPATGGSATFSSGGTTATAITNASGIAVSPVPMANGVVRAYTVSATVTGLPAVTFNLANTAPVNPATATFVKTDWATRGNWQSVYGADGYNVIGDQASNPWYGTPQESGASSYTWAATTADGRALQKASNPGSRIAATWFSGSSFIVDVNLIDGAVHQVALYCLDWDSSVRREKVDVLDTEGNTLDTEVLGSSFNGGVYLVWNVSGHVQFRFTNLAGNNAVVSGLFFDAPNNTIAAVGSTPQNTSVNTAFATTLEAIVTHANGSPVSGVTVTFTTPTTGASAIFSGGTATATAVTNASGVAAAPALTANNQAGSYTVSASVPGVAKSASFAFTNSAAPARDTATSSTLQSTTPR